MSWTTRRQKSKLYKSVFIDRLSGGCSHCHVILQRKSQRLPNLTTHTLNEACRKTAGTLSPHGSLHADKGYDSVTCRSICRNHGLHAIILQRRTAVGLGALARGGAQPPDVSVRLKVEVKVKLSVEVKVKFTAEVKLANRK